MGITGFPGLKGMTGELGRDAFPGKNGHEGKRGRAGPSGDNGVEGDKVCQHLATQYSKQFRITFWSLIQELY